MWISDLVYFSSLLRAEVLNIDLDDAVELRQLDWATIAPPPSLDTFEEESLDLGKSGLERARNDS